MAWELNIRKSKDEENLLPIGSISEVQKKIGETFPDVYWQRNGSGAADLADGGVIQFHLNEDPVTMAIVSVHGADPTNQLLQLAKATGWYVEDMSSGQRLKKSAAPAKPSRKKQPKTQTWEELFQGDDLTDLHLIELQPRESPSKAYGRYADWEDKQPLPEGFRSFVGSFTDFTVQVPHVGHMSPFHYRPRATEKSRELVEQYCAETGRIHGRIKDSQIVLSDGTSLPREQAEIHRR